MSRRTKLCITALFLVLLAVPTWYLVHTWHPANPLRFRHVGEWVGEDTDFGGHYHKLKMELRNTSDVTVVFIVASFHEIPTPGEEAIMATGNLGDLALDTYTIPPGRTVEVEFYGHTVLTAERLKKLQAGEWHPRTGRIQYQWLSPSKMRLGKALTWLYEKVPPRWLDKLPRTGFFIDTTEVEPEPQRKPASPAGSAP